MATKKKVVKKSKKYILFISYPADLYFQNFDKKIEKAIGDGEELGSGMGFGRRDIDVSYNSLDDAMNAETKVKRLHRDIKTSIDEFDED